jgi:hypothetical protein
MHRNQFGGSDSKIFPLLFRSKLIALTLLYYIDNLCGIQENEKQSKRTVLEQEIESEWIQVDEG